MFYSTGGNREIRGNEIHCLTVNESEVPEYAVKKASGVIVHHNCIVHWVQWSGYEVFKQEAEECRAKGCTVSVKGKTATITLPDGSSFNKRTNTKGFSFLSINN